MAIANLSVQLSGSMRASATLTPQGTASTSTLTNPQSSVTGGSTQVLSYGTSTAQADILCSGDFTLTAGSSVTLDLYTGTDFKDVFGATAALRKLKSIELHIVTGGDTAGVTIGNAASNGTALFFGANTQTWTIYPSGAPFMGGSPAGVAIGSTTKNLKVLNNGAISVTVRLVIAGTSV